MTEKCPECGLPIDPEDAHRIVDEDGQAWHVECSAEFAERKAWAEEIFGEDRD